VTASNLKVTPQVTGKLQGVTKRLQGGVTMLTNIEAKWKVCSYELQV